MKIAYFMTELGLSGGPMTIFNFMNGLVNKGHDVYMVTMYDAFRWDFDTHKRYINKSYPLKKRKVFYGMARHYLNKLISLTGTNFRITSDKLRSITTSFARSYKNLGIDCDILIASAPFTGPAVYNLGAGKKIVMHNQHFELLTTSIKEEQESIELITRYPFNHIVNCTWLDKMFRHYYGIKGHLITPGMNHNIFNTPYKNCRYNNVTRVKLLTYCDPRRKFKGTTQQLKILFALYKENKNIEISIYGLDPKTNLFPYKFLGWVTQEQLAKYYGESHLLVSFSWYESFPLPPIEAMACGTCVVSGKYGTENYLIDGKTGIIIDPFDIEGSTEKILTLIRNPQRMETLARNGVAMAKKFTWETQVDKLNDFLLNLPEPRSIPIREIQNGNLKALDKIYN